MPTTTPLVSDFSAGELSPWLYGRSDMPVYYKGASTFLRFVPKGQGGFFKSPGTLVCGHSFNDVSARLVPFVVSQTQGYALEFTNQKIQIWLNGVMIGTVGGVIPYLTADIPSLQFYSSFPDLFITHQGYPPARIRWTTPNTLTYLVLTYSTNTITFTGNTHGSVTVDNVPTNLLPAESTWLLTDADGDIPAGTYITAVAPTVGSSPLTYTSTISQAATGTHVGDTFTLTLQPAPFSGSGNYPRTCAVMYQRLFMANTKNAPQDVFASGVGIYDPIADPTGANGIVYMRWSEISTFSVPVLQTNSDGTPTTTPPTFTPTPAFQDQVDDDDAFDYTINSQYDDEIAWLANAIDIAIGSASGEWIAPGASTANNFSANIVANDGAGFIQPIFVTGGMLFVQRDGQKIYRFNWQGAANPFIPPDDITFFSEHLFINNPIQQEAIQVVPERHVWYLRNDGTCAVMLWDFVYGTRSFWRFQTSGTIVGLCVVPGTDLQGNGGRDIVHIAVQRTIGGTTYTFIEQLATPYWSSQSQAIFSDCATFKTNAVKFTTMAVDTGLNGATLEVVADGVYIGTAVPAGGVLTLPKGVSANNAVCGLNFTSQVTTMPLVPPSQEGTGQLKKKAIPKARFRVYNTLYMRAGQFTTPNAGGLSPMTYVKMGDTGIGGLVLNSSTPSAVNPTLYSGYARCSILESLRDDAYLSIVSDLPLPCAVTAIVPDVSDVEAQ